MDLNTLLKIAVEKKASDLHIKLNTPPRYRISGTITQVISNPISQEHLNNYVKTLLNAEQIQKLKEHCDVDVSYFAPDIGRFRVNIFRQNNSFAMVMRHIPTKIPTISELNLPPVLSQLAMEERGIILVTGTTGSGKSTTLAGMINEINEKEYTNIITIEDPIEFVHADKKSIISQRAIGIDAPSFLHALKYVLRQDPDVILIGEMRDYETISTAITAAETGHLVFSTLHTTNASQTVERIINVYPQNLHGQIRLQLSLNLMSVISQRLLPLADGNGRVAALEILISTPTVKKQILEGEINKLSKTMEDGTLEGMQTFNQALLKLLGQSLITEEAAMAASEKPEELRLAMKLGA